MEISRVSGQFPQDRICEAASDSSGDMRDEDELIDQASQQVSHHLTSVLEKISVIYIVDNHDSSRCVRLKK